MGSALRASRAWGPSSREAHMDLDTLYRRTVDVWTDRVKGVGPDQWDGPTPCSGWSVRELINHVVGEDLWTVPLVGGSTIEEVGDRFDGDVLGDDPVGTAVEAAKAPTTGGGGGPPP